MMEMLQFRDNGDTAEIRLSLWKGQKIVLWLGV